MVPVLRGSFLRLRFGTASQVLQSLAHLTHKYLEKKMKIKSIFAVAIIPLITAGGLFAQNKDATKSEKEVRAWVKK